MTLEEKINHLRTTSMEEARAESNAIIDSYRDALEKVFEKYEFPYDSENLNEILESVNPDVTILMGAFDTNYYWNGEERENVRFVSHLVNILVAHSRFKKTK